MKWGAHSLIAAGMAVIALGEVSRLVLSPASLITLFLFFVGGILSAQLGAVLPDLIDFTFSRTGAHHRNSLTHGIPSLVIPLLLATVTYSLLFMIFPLYLILAGGIMVGLPTGWITHLVLDALTPHGIPLPSGQFTWDWANYDSPAGNRVLKIVGIIWILAGFLTILDPVVPLFIPLVGALWASRWRSDRVKESDIYVKVLTTENAEVVAVLTAIGMIHKRRGDAGRAIAYRNAASSIRNLRWSLKENYARTPLRNIPFVGPKIAGVIEDLLVHGHSNYLEFLRGAPTIRY